MPVSGSTSVAAQRTMRLTTFSRARPDRDFRAEQIELVPGRPALDLQIAAEAERMHRCAGGVFQGGDRREVDDRDDLPRHVGKAVAVGAQHLRRAAQFVGAELGEEPLDRGAPFRRAEIAARGLAVFERIVSVWLVSSKAVRSSARRSFRISIRKRCLGR